MRTHATEGASLQQLQGTSPLSVRSLNRMCGTQEVCFLWVTLLRVVVAYVLIYLISSCRNLCSQ